jgi:hypothetical protein
MTQDELINAFAVGIAFAEGFYVNGSRPQRNHNPGDLTVDTIGLAVGRDGPFVVYANDNDGWNALKEQVRKIVTNTSSIYNSDMTINDIAQKYTTTDQAAWAMNVASKLGVSPDTRIGDLMTIAEVATAGIGIGAVIVAIIAIYFLRKK